MKLTNMAVKTAKPKEKAYRLYDGGGLYLEVRPNGGKYWYVKFKYQNKEKRFSAGNYPSTSLANARFQMREVKQKLAVGINPIAERKSEKLLGHTNAENTFFAVAHEWFEAKIADKSEGYQDRTINHIDVKLVALRERPIAQITTPELHAILKGIEKNGTAYTAVRVKRTAQRIFAYAINTGRRTEHNPAISLTEAMKTPTTKHRAAILDPDLLGQMLLDVEYSTSGPVIKTAAYLSPMLFPRPHELRHMLWADINWEKKRWELPEDLMKSRRQHITPLPRQAIKALRELQPLTGRGIYVFPNDRGNSRCMSENGVRSMLRNLGYGNEVVTPHGFRATARTFLDEIFEFPVHWIEHQLAHLVIDPTGRAYNRTSHLRQRTTMMQRWADYLDELREAARHRTTAKLPEPYQSKYSVNGD